MTDLLSNSSNRVLECACDDAGCPLIEGTPIILLPLPVATEGGSNRDPLTSEQMVPDLLN